MIALVRGDDIGVHGLISGRAKLKGPTTAVALEGRLRVEDLHGWDQSVPKGEKWPLDLHGRWNMPAQHLELDARVEGAEQPILNVHYTVEQYVTQPRWGVSVELNHFAVDPLLPLARHLGVALPDGLQVAGLADGVLSYSDRESFQGHATLHQTKVALPGSPPLALDDAELRAKGRSIWLLPVRVVSADREEAQVEARYDSVTQRADVRIASNGMSVAALGKQASLAAVPLLSQISAGQWSGDLNYSAEPGSDPVWTGNIALQEGAVAFPGFAAPVLVQSAQCRMDADGVVLERIRATAAGVPVEGDYEYAFGEDRPNRFHLRTAAVSGAELETWLMPTLHRQTGLFGITLRLGRRAPIPEWLANWHAEGTLQIGKLELPNMDLDRVRTRIVWDTTRVTMPDFTAEAGGGAVRSRVLIDLRNASPEYQAVSKLDRPRLEKRQAGRRCNFETSGTGAGLLTNLRASGTFTGRAVLEDVESVNGHYEFNWKGLLPQLTLNDLRLTSSAESYSGKGSLQDDGTLVLQLNSGTHQMRVAGTLARDGALRWMP